MRAARKKGLRRFRELSSLLPHVAIMPIMTALTLGCTANGRPRLMDGVIQSPSTSPAAAAQIVGVIEFDSTVSENMSPRSGMVADFEWRRTHAAGVGRFITSDV